MTKYEMLIMLNNDLTEEAKNAEIEKYENIVKSMNGNLLSTDKWGAKKLAYPINDLTDGYYYVVNFTAAATVPAELDRVFNITDGILRSLVVRLDK